MFRYVAFAWDASRPEVSAFAEQLGRTLQQQAGWSATLQRAGLLVLVHGETPGVNQAYALQGGQGVVLGKVFRRRDLVASPSADQQSDSITSREANRILAAGGQVLVDEFWGRYVAFLQAADGSTDVVRDPSGTLPCHLLRHEGLAIVFSWLEDVLQLLNDRAPWRWTPRVDQDAIANQLREGAITGRQACLEGLTHLIAGERLNLHSGARATLWDGTAFARSPLKCDIQEAADRLRDLVRACTATWARCCATILMRLSGGVDSSILLTCLAPTRVAADVIGLNYFSEGSNSDERHYARLVAMKVGRDLLEQQRDPGFRIERVLQVARMPDPMPYIGSMNAGTDARLAASYGARSMFTGGGGDSLFYEFPAWWPAADYFHNEGLNAGFVSAATDAARLGRLSVWRTIALALTRTRGPNIGEKTTTAHTALLAPDLRNKAAVPQRLLHPAVQQAAGLPLGKYMQTIALLHPIGYYDPFEQANAPETVNPLLSQPLVEYCLQLPTYQLIQGGRGRALARRAFAKDLPQQIVNRRSKGGMEDHAKAVLESNLDLIRELLLDGQLAARGLIDRPKVGELLSGRPTTLPSATSQIHSLVAIEAWLTRWV
ncbi:asparagine synthase C-terminal domain-containing protein [Paucibacter sp. R3-3]|uniref:asparagine synthase (glutamine-hydrolyzing) n=1 Tax=Roseateles agri TaxID=3098619 RepID=A0ABU5DU43_9BURK|nr:asparagine synthase C-terminal domain-containing protein [Paucibacter sp. R3-3]MDY0749099.1 asparagine synthase C-terminal domain-containing protein [Paucibacter sp. R3-3]